MANRPNILGLVEAAWGKTGTAAPTEDTLDTGKSSSSQQTARSGGGSTKAPGYGARKGVRKPAPAPPPRRKP